MADQRMAHPELARIEIRGHTRNAFLLRSALAGGAVWGMGAVSPFVKRAFAQTGTNGGGAEQDIEILNFALLLENLEATFYERARSELELSSEVDQLAELLGGHETEHANALTQAIQDLGGTADEAPELTFDFSNEEAFLETAQTLEGTGVGAYNGAGPQLSSKELLSTAGTIVQIEARHTAAVALQRGSDPTDGSFDEGLEMSTVQERVQPFIQS